MFHQRWLHQGGLVALAVLMVVAIVGVCPNAIAQYVQEAKTDTVACGCSFRDTVDTDTGLPIVVLPITLEPHKYPQGVVSQLMLDGKLFNYLSCTVPECSGFKTEVDSVAIVKGLEMLILTLDFTHASWGEHGKENPPQQIEVELRFTALTAETSLTAGISKAGLTVPCRSSMFIFGNEAGEAVMKNCDGGGAGQ